MTALSRLPLNALRVFEAAARQGRFDRAAQELSITPGAVSRQIKALEAELGVRLFDRFNRAVRLTETGERLAAAVTAGLVQIEQAVGRARARTDGPLVVSILHSMAVKWLVPRLQLFYARYPDADILISASDRPVDLTRSEADISIRYGPGPYPGLDARRLMASDLFPVCSPRLLDEHPLRTPADLAGVTLLHDNSFLADEPRWPDWLKRVGAEGVDGDRGPRFSNTYLQLEAAMSGRGVVLAHEVIVQDDLRAGRLVRPFKEAVTAPYSYWALCLPERADQPAIRRFRAWLGEQADAHTASTIA
jgi:LysR family transcriptional regulator, glycine cleavage system transcriptional activator